MCVCVCDVCVCVCVMCEYECMLGESGHHCIHPPLISGSKVYQTTSREAEGRTTIPTPTMHQTPPTGTIDDIIQFGRCFYGAEAEMPPLCLTVLKFSTSNPDEDYRIFGLASCSTVPPDCTA